MSEALTEQQQAAESLGKLDSATMVKLANGDLSGLTDMQKVQYYTAVCESIGLNYLTHPFDFLQMQGKLTLYANRSASDQLRAKRQISIEITDRRLDRGVYTVTARATMPDGRSDESTGCVPIAQNVSGEALANAYMKAETKAKRRVTLSIAGLGWLDEMEVATIRGAEKQPMPEVKIEIPPEPAGELEGVPPDDTAIEQPSEIRQKWVDIHKARESVGWSRDELSKFVHAEYAGTNPVDLTMGQLNDIYLALNQEVDKKLEAAEA